MLEWLLSPIRRTEGYAQTTDALGKGAAPVAVYGLSEAMPCMLAAALAHQGVCGGRVVIAAPSQAQAMRAFEDISRVMPGQAVYFPAADYALFGARAKSREASNSRLAALHAWACGKARALVCPAEALMNPVPPRDVLEGAVIHVARGDILDMEALLSDLSERGYERCDIVEGRGQMAARGSIIDVYPVDTVHAVRIEFFDDEVDTIRLFDPNTQRSGELVEETDLIPASEVIFSDRSAAAALLRADIDAAALADKDEPTTLGLDALDIDDDDELDQLPSLWDMKTRASTSPRFAALERCWQDVQAGRRADGDEIAFPYAYPKAATLFDYGETLWLIDEPNRAKERCDDVKAEFDALLKGAVERHEALGAHASLMRGWDFVANMAERSSTVLCNQLMVQSGDIAPKTVARIEGGGVTSYHSRFDMLTADVVSAATAGFAVALMASGQARATRLADTLEKAGVDVIFAADEREIPSGAVAVAATGPTRGFRLPEAGFMALSEADIYGISKRPGARRKAETAGQKLRAFTDLAPGDYVVHDSHGIGVYVGVEKLEVGGKIRDYLHIQYNGTDKLYIPTDQMDRVQKYIGSNDARPKLSKLGGGEWERQKNKVRKSIKEMAFDLVKLYADRQQAKGFAYSRDNNWQREFEDKFPYEETPDQDRCIEEIKADMEKPVCMDRLLCGDVGYGKTEVALRAAFKAVMDGKQVALLVPTTILAQQHYQTILRRFEGFPVRADFLSGFKSAEEQKRTVEALNRGDLDIIVGTHRLLNKDVRPKRLGLLIIDEEQRFGVAHKEQLKLLRKDIDVLTLSATPIPRSLHMSMVGIRDMSTLETPPEERYPVMTYVTEYSDSLARDAIMRELARGGQAYFVYNRVASIDRFAERLRALVPEARVVVAHGQMKEGRLEEIMLDFMDHKYDVLLCSTIIESGLDISDVNTMIVFDADRFGLSQLYQLRGRVGRSNRIAHCYLMVRENKVITETAQKRLAAIKEFTEFGSGFKVAMRDLEIRGAGNLIGAQQSGHMVSVGYDMYVRLISEAVSEIKGSPVKQKAETSVNLPVDAFLPDGYVFGHEVRMDVYKLIAGVANANDREDCIEELVDRFGDVPRECDNLIYMAMVKNCCEAIGVEQVFMRREQIVLRFAEKADVDPVRLINAMTRAGGKSLTLAATQPAAMLYTPKRGEQSEQTLRRLAAILGSIRTELEAPQNA